MGSSNKTSGIDEAEVVTKEIKELICSNDFIVINRDKNKNFMRKFRLNQTRIKNILMGLSKFDYVEEVCDYGNEVHGDEPLIVFEKELMLTDFHGNDRLVIIYIKIKEVNNRRVPIVSFHESEK